MDSLLNGDRLYWLYMKAYNDEAKAEDKRAKFLLEQAKQQTR